MKKIVIDYEEAQRRIPFFKTPFGFFMLKKLFRWLDIHKVNYIHSKYCELRGSDFTSAVMKDPLMDVRYTVHNHEVLDQLPEGAFITVANHPIGSLDGIIMIDIFASQRPNYRLMVNEILSNISAMADNFFPVVPKTDATIESNPMNVNGIRLAFSHLKKGHPMGFFPAGAMSSFDKKQKKICDRSWMHSIIRLIRKANVPVFPVYFDCLNSKFFYRTGRISWKIRQFLVAIEAFNKKGRNLHVYLGQPIPPETIHAITDDNELARFLYNTTYSVNNS